MPSTAPSSGVQTSTIILATLGTVTTAALAYAVYFDYKRRSDPAFRRSLKRQQKQVSKAAKDEAVAAQKGQKDRLRQAVDEANAEGFPEDPEKTEEYFMTEVARGEQMCQDGSDPVDAALCFYKALKVYPQPRELINIYDKTVPKVKSPAHVLGAYPSVLTYHSPSLTSWPR
jgi:import receptor subunit TOM20